jgi:hypothetical protein
MTNSKAIGLICQASTSKAEALLYSKPLASSKKPKYNGATVTIQDGELTFLGQISDVSMRSRLAGNEELQTQIAYDGCPAPGISSLNNKYTADVVLMAAADVEAKKARGIPLPPAGQAEVFLLQDDDRLDGNDPLGKLRPWTRYQQGVAVIGADIEDRSALMSVVVKDASPEAKGGLAEGRSTLTIGRSGSLKSVLECSLLSLRLAANPKMGFLGIDPKREFSEPLKHKYGPDKHMLHHGLINAAVPLGAQKLKTVGLEDVSVTSKDLLREFVDRLCDNCGLSSEPTIREQLINRITSGFCQGVVDGNGKRTSIPSAAKMTAENLEELGPKAIAVAYKNKDAKASALEHWANNDFPKNEEVVDQLAFLRKIFGGYVTVKDLCLNVAQRGHRYVLTFGDEIGDDVGRYVVNEILDTLVNTCIQLNVTKKSAETVANCILMIEEAHTYFPAEPKTKIAKRLVDSGVSALTKLRSFGVFIDVVTQSIRNLHSPLVDQCQQKFFGKGLTSPADERALKQALGATGYAQYLGASRAAGMEDFPWVMTGDLCNLQTGADGVVVFQPFVGNMTKQLVEANRQLIPAFKDLDLWSIDGYEDDDELEDRAIAELEFQAEVERGK